MQAPSINPTQLLSAQLAEAEADLARAREQRAYLDHQADVYRARAAEPDSPTRQANLLNQCVQYRHQAVGVERECFDLASRVRMLRSMLAEAEQGGEVVLTFEQMADMDDTHNFCGVAA